MSVGITAAVGCAATSPATLGSIHHYAAGILRLSGSAKWLRRKDTCEGMRAAEWFGISFYAGTIGDDAVNVSIALCGESPYLTATFSDAEATPAQQLTETEDHT